MIRCEEIRAQLVFYLDRELSGEDCRVLETHVHGCSACRTELERERGFLGQIRAAVPLYSAPECLRKRLESMLPEETKPVLPSRQPAVPEPIPHRRRRRRVVAWAAMMLIACAGLWLGLRADWAVLRGGPSEFALAAVDVHQRYLRGALPLEFASEDPERISAWFAGKLAFPLPLPNHAEAAQKLPAYRLKGARLAGFEGDYVAYVAYEMGAAPIGLLVASAAAAKPSGGERIVSRGLVFHHDAIAGYKVITWTDRGLTYALVSALAGRGEESCGVCHAGANGGVLPGAASG